MHPLTTILFDVGGVLLRTEDRRPRAKLADSLGLSGRELENIVFNGKSGHAAQRGEVSAGQHWEWVRKKLGIRPDEVESVRDAFFSGDVLDRELVAFVSGLNPPFRTGIITNAFDDARAALSDNFQLDRTFDPIVVSAEEGVMKPDARIYRTALERCGAQAAETIFVDDFRHNIQAAQDLGLHAIWFRSREQTISELKAAVGIDSRGRRKR